MSTTAPQGTTGYLAQQFHRALMAPIRAFHLRYLPLLMVYFAYGAMGLIAVAQSFFERRGLTMSPADLAALGVWLALPWAIKMVFGELVDTVALLGSRRRIYVFLGAAMVATSLVLLAAAAGGWLSGISVNALYIAASLLGVLGIVLQDVVADAMSTEVVARTNPDGTAREKSDVDYDLGMVQALGRLALFAGILLTARLAGWLAESYSYETVFLIGLVVPLISVSGAMLVRLDASEEARPTDWRILGGGLAFGAVVVLVGILDLSFSQEIVFVISMVVVIAMLVRVTADLAHETRLKIAFAALLIFAFRATPGVGPGYAWFTMDVLAFDEAFFGRLREIGALLAILAAWFLSDAITRQPVARVLLWLTLAAGVLAIPNILLVTGTYTQTGLEARTIAILDAAAESPLAQVSMIPLLTLAAIYAPPQHRATWFALMASFMNLALVAGQLQTKYLNLVFPIARGAYEQLPALVTVSAAIALVLPLIAIIALWKRVR